MEDQLPFLSDRHVCTNWWAFVATPCAPPELLIQRCSQALLSVYDKTNLLELATGLHGAGVRLLGSGGTAKKIREAGIPIE